VVGIEIVGSIPEILRLLEDAKFGERHVVVYPDLDDFRKIYGQYTKKHVEQDNEVVVLLPFYETVDSVITFLHRQQGIDVAKHGKEGSLLIVDSYKAYSGFVEDRELFYKRVVSHAAFSGKRGISILMDMGASSFIKDIERIAVNYQSMIPPQRALQVKGFFSYHRKDYEKLSESQKSARFSNNYKSLIISS
jgi:hypothetical protein